MTPDNKKKDGSWVDPLSHYREMLELMRNNIEPDRARWRFLWIYQWRRLALLRLRALERVQHELPEVC
jgi:hypothetical protein